MTNGEVMDVLSVKELNVNKEIIQESLAIDDGIDISVGSTTGSKIGSATTEKLGLWGVTPVVQPIAATGGAMTVDQLLVILQTTGIVKQA